VDPVAWEEALWDILYQLRGYAGAEAQEIRLPSLSLPG
jgi:hypothetical protein